jgi:hypothetical protein
MDAICRKCGNSYQAKRRTSKYCKKSCRSAYNQQVKRGLALANPLSDDEASLLEIVQEVVQLAATIWAEVQTGAARLSIPSIERLGRCARIGTLDKVKELQERYAEKQRLNAKKQQAKKKPAKPAQEKGGQEDSDS